MPNRYHSMTPPQLHMLATSMTTVLDSTGGSAYSISVPQKLALVSATNALGNSMQAVSDSKAAYRSSVQTRDLDDKTLMENVAGLAKTLYANPAITDAMLVAIGLEPRPSTRTKHLPIVPTEFAAVPAVDGTVKLTWKRNGNVSGTSFLIEQKIGSTWTFICSTTTTKLTLTGYTPGATSTFRVIATRLQMSSPASNEFTIYPNGVNDFALHAA